MKIILVLCLAFGIAYSAVINNSKDDKLLILVNRRDDIDQTYNYRYETLSGTKVEQHGYLKYVTPNATGNSVEGRFSYIGNDGEEYKIAYTAGEFGYQPSGRHIPSVPPAIKKALKYIAEHPYVEPTRRTTNKQKS
ncbi:flexible cuticle protein 12-like [Episyrphus balteatus]|uniref:flexible cuticle protein 12-like n=1 Tax=Episyrphus balteatus TaxID=286459 RepID=UPI0024859954|nr:flexible cuticle protein 12-like [Episyrphus balteatus]